MGTLRSTRTEQYLVEALIELGEKKSVQKVQVKELCEAAQVNRTTFYKHYVDMGAFLEAVIQHFFDRMEENLDGCSLFEGLLVDDAETTCLRCTEFMNEHRAFVGLMAGSHGIPEFRRRILAAWEDACRGTVLRLRPDLGGSVDIDILARMVVSGMWGLLEFCIDPEVMYHPQYIAKHMYQVVYVSLLKPLIG